jgi:hypothetical protein
MQDAMRLYIENGIDGGNFLNAVLCNDLMGATARADYINRGRLFDFCDFLYNEVPEGCHGSREKVEAWIARGGLKGQAEKERMKERE